MHEVSTGKIMAKVPSSAVVLESGQGNDSFFLITYDAGQKSQQESAPGVPDRTQLAMLQEPAAVTVWSRKESSLANLLASPPDSDSLNVICLSPDSPSRAAALEWVRQGDIIHVNRKPLEVFMSAGRVVLIAGDKNLFGPALTFVAKFCFFDRTLTEVETVISKSWDRLDGDLRLTHRVSDAEVIEWKSVQEMTELVSRLRIKLVRLEPIFLTLSSMVAPEMEKFAESVIEQTLVEDRLEAASDRLEVFEDTYELANDRISEFSFFRYESKLEVWIIVILLAELALLLAELCLGLLK